MTPSWRKPAGVGLILLLAALWCVVIASIAPAIGGWPQIAQALFYLVAGVGWILPLGPLLAWMEADPGAR